jgi:hypothetical protein
MLVSWLSSTTTGLVESSLDELPQPESTLTVAANAPVAAVARMSPRRVML